MADADQFAVEKSKAGPLNDGDEQLLRGRVYGRDHDDPNPGPLPHRTYAALDGGPLDGLLLDITGWRPEEVDDGVGRCHVVGCVTGLMGRRRVVGPRSGPYSGRGGLAGGASDLLPDGKADGPLGSVVGGCHQVTARPEVR